MAHMHLVLIRDDLRIHDHQALLTAVNSARKNGGRVATLYIYDEESPGIRPLGNAVRWWLHQSLERFAQSLNKLNIPFLIARGQTAAVVQDFATELNITHLHWSRRYAQAERTVDNQLEEWAKINDIKAQGYPGFLLHEPEKIHPASGPFYKVFTPFWKTVSVQDFRTPLPAPSKLEVENQLLPNIDHLTFLYPLSELKLLSNHSHWTQGLEKQWNPGEKTALETSQIFANSMLPHYSERRDYPSKKATSYLSPHLRFGEISPATVLYHIYEAHPDGPPDTAHFASEIGWREFCWHLTFHNSDMYQKEFKPDWTGFPWRKENQPGVTEEVIAWQQGNTGIPLVDAGMRELWCTGFMHNRVRMVASSFLTKNLLIDWRIGEQWFWDTLVDADLASNACNWQWVAGCGADASPYFRIFNPALQSRKFDKETLYIQHWIPELNSVNQSDIHDAGLKMSEIPTKDYPKPLVDLKASRQIALMAYKNFRNAQ